MQWRRRLWSLQQVLSTLPQTNNHAYIVSHCLRTGWLLLLPYLQHREKTNNLIISIDHQHSCLCHSHFLLHSGSALQYSCLSLHRLDLYVFHHSLWTNRHRAQAWGRKSFQNKVHMTWDRIMKGIFIILTILVVSALIGLYIAENIISNNNDYLIGCKGEQGPGSIIMLSV